ncbi:MAG: hypothetical protein EPO22_05500 [Dehalococcoidia bacterium]|nr:MAG: hypothetical protein EPO22_05500 [Dehalococcoidia bacterium]
MMHVTTATHGQPPQSTASVPRPSTSLLTAIATTCAVTIAVLAVAALRRDAPGRGATAAAFPAHLAAELTSPQDAAAAWREPADVAIGEHRWLLDTGNNRVLELAADGTVARTIVTEPPLSRPMALATDGENLYVADSGAARVVVFSADGGVVRAFPVGGVRGDQLPARPIGIAVAPDGDVLVADAANHRVLRYAADGQLLWSFGAGRRAAGTAGLNTPGGLALDAAGNVHAVDILNGRVVKLSPGGAFVAEYGHLGETAGALARPKDVAVDAAGNVYVSDSLLAAVQVFGPDGEYRGFIGLKDPADRRSGALFRSPAGLAISGSALYVVDRLSSVFVLELPGAP